MKTPHIAEKAPKALTLEPGTHYWCACGKSKKQPFCDGSHRTL
jgi:CDGSH-type Zn-finger protein